MEINQNGAEFIAPLDDLPHESRKVKFQDWWFTPVIIDNKNNIFNRKDIVTIMADQDGGAHVDKKIDKKYAELSQGNSLGWTDLKNRPIPGAELVAVRQIAHEVLKTLRVGYVAKSLSQRSTGFIIGGLSISPGPMKK